MLKKLALILLFLGVGSAAFAYSFWRSLTGTPQWYSRQEATEVSVQPIPTDATDKINEVQEQLQQNDAVDFKLSAPEIDQILANEVQASSHLLQLAPSLQTNVNDETIEIGTAINASEIPLQSLTDEQRRVVEKALSIPQLHQDVYVGIEGTPKAEAGKIRFDETSRIKVGTLSFSVEEVSQRLGVPSSEILRQLELNLDQLDVQDIELSNGEVTFKVAPDLR